VVTFQTHVSYPTTIYTGQGFQIIIGGHIIEIEKRKLSDDEKFYQLIREGYHSFELDLPGLEFSPKEPLKLAVDDNVRWQVAPPRDPGLYIGYIRHEKERLIPERPAATRRGDGVRWMV
jgi:hypothetical protein